MLGILKLTLRSNTPSQTLANTKNVQEVFEYWFQLYTKDLYIFKYTQFNWVWKKAHQTSTLQLLKVVVS